MASGDFRSAIAQLRDLRHLALNLGDDELSATMSESIEWLRDASVGLLGERSGQLPAHLDEWAGQAVPTPFA
jgi:hypothetical protein